MEKEYEDFLSEITEQKIEWKNHRIIGVYFLFKNEKLIYIGSSTNCLERFIAHKKNIDFNSYHIIKYNISEIREKEAFYIEKDHSIIINKVIPGTPNKPGGLIKYHKPKLIKIETDDPKFYKNKFKQEFGGNS